MGAGSLRVRRGMKSCFLVCFCFFFVLFLEVVVVDVVAVFVSLVS